MRRRRRRVTRRAGAVLGASIVVVSACGSTGDEPPTVAQVSGTVAMGRLPEPATAVGPTVAPATIAPTTTEPEPEPIAPPIGDVADGDRLLLIGDTALMTLTPRHEGVACDVLSAAGWQVDIEAERGRYIDFGAEVVGRLVVDAADRWSVIGLMFGQHVDTTPDEFGAALDDLLDTVGDVPVLLYTRSEIDDDSATINEVIRSSADDRPNVLIVDWGRAIVDEEELTLVDGEGLPTADGMERLVVLTAAALGDAPTGAGGDGGECLDPVFSDDSAIVL